MAEKEYVKRINRRLVHAGSIVDVYSDTMELPDGNTQEWDFVSHRTGAACVLPVLDDGRIVLVHQYRPALNRMTWEVPAGCRDSLDEPTIVSSLISLKTTVAFCDEAIDVYLARNLKPGKQQLDEAEVIDVKAWTMEEALEEIYAGRIQDSKTVAAILAYETKVLLGDK